MELKRFGKPKDNGIVELDDKNSHIAVAVTYAELVRKVTGKTIYFLTGNMESKKYQKKVEQIRKLIKICIDFGVPFEQYMQVQFDRLIPWLKKEKGLYYPPFNMLISDGAVTRFNQWYEQNEKKYESRREARQALQPVRTDYRRALFDSAQKFKERLEKVGKDDVLGELEMFARLGKVTRLYVYSHPKVQEGGDYLKRIYQEMNIRLTDDEKLTVSNIRKLVCRELGDGEGNV